MEILIIGGLMIVLKLYLKSKINFEDLLICYVVGVLGPCGQRP